MALSSAPISPRIRTTRSTTSTSMGSSTFTAWPTLHPDSNPNQFATQGSATGFAEFLVGAPG